MVNYRDYFPLVILAGLILLSFFVIKPIILAIILGALLASALYPLQEFFSRKINKNLSAFLVCIVVLIILVVPGFFIMEALVKEAYVLFISVKQKLAIGLFQSCKNNFCITLKEFGQMPEVNMQIKEIIKFVTNWIIQKGSDVVIALPKTMLNLFVMLFSMFYFLRDGKVFVEKIHDVIGMSREKYNHILKRLKEIFQGVLYGYLLVALIQGAVGALGFFLIGITSPLFWGIVMAFLALIPSLGTGLIWAPAAIIMFLDGVFQDSNVLIFKGIGLFLYGLLIISSIDNILRPKLVSEKAKVHPGIILTGILGGVLTMGMLGVFIGPIILSLTVVFVESYFEKRS